jgi:DNA helicase-2/ATP-dependent DNA helicase PcrA
VELRGHVDAAAGAVVRASKVKAAPPSRLPSDPPQNDTAPAPAVPGRQWSIFQRAIFADVAEGSGHVLVRARAGTGKTTTIVESLRHIPAGKSSLLVAFNKAIARELEARAPGTVQVRTLHAFGFAALRSAFRTRLDDGKVERIARDFYGDSIVRGGTLGNLAKLVSRAKATLAADEEDLDLLIDDMALDVPDRQRPEFIERAAEVLGACFRETSACDFDDMIWLTLRHGVRLPTFDFVFIDETQDLNASQIDLALGAVKRGGRVVAVGDDRQAIYGFRGADANAVDNVIDRLSARVLPLSITYRCGKAIVALARKIVPDFEAAPTAPDGNVRTVTEATLRAEAAPGEFVISRKNAPLIGLCLGFIMAGKAAIIAGRDVGAGLLSLVNRANEETVMGLLLHIDRWRQTETARLLARGRDIQAVEDRADCVAALCEGAADVAEVRARIAALFTDKDDSQRIVCTTTHKAKGLERERVWVLADTFSKGSTEEDNLWYVAITRAKGELCISGERAEARQR